MADDYDAVVVGSGPNGLAAAATLTAAGLRLLVIEGAAGAGGGCRTQELTLPGFRHDVCSATHPLALASPFFRRFNLAQHGVRFGWPEVEFAHPLDGGLAGVVTRSVAETASRLGQDGGAYRRLFGPLTDHADAVVGAVLSSMRRPPPNPAAAAMYARLGLRSARHVAARFRTQEARGLFAGVAAHAMMPLSRPPTAGLGLLFGTLAHAVGWPVVIGGSEAIIDAMTDYICAGGGRVETGWWVRSLAEIPHARVVLLDISPRALLSLAGDRLPARYASQLRRFRYGSGVFKADFALAGPVPWANQDCRRAGTLHLGGSFEEIAAAEADTAAGRQPARPYAVVVQPGVADGTRAPAGRQVLWTYCHVPAGSTQDMTSAIRTQIERFAPGFGDLVLATATRTAAEEEAQNPNYVGGDIASGVVSIAQTFARPVPRWNPYRTPLPGIYLCSSSTPPGPGVHGRCGELAALSALRDHFGVRREPDFLAAASVTSAKAKTRS